MSKAPEERQEFKKLRRLWMKEHNWDGFICARCGKYSKSVHLHHIKELIYGGENDPKNLIPLCGDCHHELDCFGSEFPFEDFLVTFPSFAMPALLLPEMETARKHFKTDQFLRVCSAAYRCVNLAKQADKLVSKGMFPSELDKEQNKFFSAYPYSDDGWRSKRLDELYGPLPVEVA